MEEDSAETNVVQFPRLRPLSDIKIEEHTKLVTSYRATRQLQRVIARRLEACTTSESAGDILNGLPANTNKRIAIRLALNKATNAKGQSPRDALMQEYAHLDKVQRSLRSRLLKMEKHVLSAQPASFSEARSFLRILANLVILERNINKRLLSNAMERCAGVMKGVAHLPAQKR